jgi:hypothetical protein
VVPQEGEQTGHTWYVKAKKTDGVVSFCEVGGDRLLSRAVVNNAAKFVRFRRVVSLR